MKKLAIFRLFPRYQDSADYEGRFHPFTRQPACLPLQLCLLPRKTLSFRKVSLVLDWRSAHYFGDLNTRARVNRPKPATTIFFRKTFW